MYVFIKKSVYSNKRHSENHTLVKLIFQCFLLAMPICKSFNHYKIFKNQTIEIFKSFTYIIKAYVIELFILIIFIFRGSDEVFTRTGEACQGEEHCQ